MNTVVHFSPDIGRRSDQSSANLAFEQTFGSRLHASENHAGKTLHAGRTRDAVMYRTLQRQSASSYNHISRFVSNTRHGFLRAKNERTLSVLGAIAGAAFIAGTLIRAWRSSRHA